MIKFTIITLFQEAIEPYLKTSMMWKATEKGLVEFDFLNLRDFGLGPHKSVDDTPYGGGDGMLLRCEPVFNAIESVKSRNPEAKVILPTPVGEMWTQKKQGNSPKRPKQSLLGLRHLGPSSRARRAHPRLARLRRPFAKMFRALQPSITLFCVHTMRGMMRGF